MDDPAQEIATRATVAFQCGDMALAQRLFDDLYGGRYDLSALEPRVVLNLRSLHAAACEEVGEYGQALSLLDSILEQSTGRASDWSTKARCLRELDRLREAIECAERAYAMDDVLCRGVFWAELCLESGDVAMCESLLDSLILRFGSEDDEVRDLLARCRSRGGRGA